MTRKSLGIVAGVSITAGGLLYSAILAPRWLETVRLRISIPDLPTEWDGLRIAHLSDFHFGGSGVSDQLIDQVKAICASFEPDLIALTGDFVDSTFASAAHRMLTEWLEEVPTFAVLGNHDYERGAPHLELTTAALEEGGVRMLRNEAIPIDLRGREAWIVGVDDPFTLHDDDREAFASVPAAEKALLFLAHSPSVVETAPIDRSALTLTGHTHGGQIRLLPSGRIPFPRLVRWIVRERGPRRDPAIFRGFHEIGDSVVVISHGIGTSQLPLRFRTRPQVLLIELVPTTARENGARVGSSSKRVERLNPSHPLANWLS